MWPNRSSNQEKRVEKTEKCGKNSPLGGKTHHSPWNSVTETPFLNIIYFYFLQSAAYSNVHFASIRHKQGNGSTNPWEHALLQCSDISLWSFSRIQVFFQFPSIQRYCRSQWNTWSGIFFAFTSMEILCFDLFFSTPCKRDLVVKDSTLMYHFMPIFVVLAKQVSTLMLDKLKFPRTIHMSTCPRFKILRTEHESFETFERSPPPSLPQKVSHLPPEVKSWIHPWRDS